MFSENICDWESISQNRIHNTVVGKTTSFPSFSSSLFNYELWQLVNTFSDDILSLPSEFKRTGNYFLSVCSLTSHIKDAIFHF